jgi:hypothetical protein
MKTGRKPVPPWEPAEAGTPNIERSTFNFEVKNLNQSAAARQHRPTITKIERSTLSVERFLAQQRSYLPNQRGRNVVKAGK